MVRFMLFVAGFGLTIAALLVRLDASTGVGIAIEPAPPQDKNACPWVKQSGPGETRSATTCVPSADMRHVRPLSDQILTSPLKK